MIRKWLLTAVACGFLAVGFVGCGEEAAPPPPVPTTKAPVKPTTAKPGTKAETKPATATPAPKEKE